MKIFWLIHKQVHDDYRTCTDRLSGLSKRELRNKKKKVEKILFLSVRIHLECKASSFKSEVCDLLIMWRVSINTDKI